MTLIEGIAAIFTSACTLAIVYFLTRAQRAETRWLDHCEIQERGRYHSSTTLAPRQPAGDDRCACPHADARACLLARYPELRRHDDTPGAYDLHIDEHCECVCHQAGDEDSEMEVDA
jgi:hypothetical protein